MYQSARETRNDDVVARGDPESETTLASGPGTAPAAERRRQLRREVIGQQLVPIELGDGNGGLVVNLSAGGATVVAVAPIEVNSRTSFAMQFSDGSSRIEGTGVFVWVDPSGLNAGLRFDPLAPRAQQLLDRWLSDPVESLPPEPVVRESSPAESLLDAWLADPSGDFPPDLVAGECQPVSPDVNKPAVAAPESAAATPDAIAAVPAPVAAVPEPIAEACATPDVVGLVADPVPAVSEAISAVPEPVATSPEPAQAVPNPTARENTESEIADKLRRLAERARRVSLANGACIALKRDDEYRCEASVGAAPVIGAAVSQDRGLAAECIAGRHLVLCNDASRDPRVSLDTNRHLSLGSAIVLPLCRGNDLFGILGVFSERRDAFGDQTIARLQDTARLIESSLYGQSPTPTNRVPERVTPPALAIPEWPILAPPREVSGSPARMLGITLLATVMLAGVVYLYQLRYASGSRQKQPPAAQVTQPPAHPAVNLPPPAPQVAQAPPPAVSPSTVSVTHEQSPARAVVAPPVQLQEHPPARERSRATVPPAASHESVAAPVTPAPQQAPATKPAETAVAPPSQPEPDQHAPAVQAEPPVATSEPAPQFVPHVQVITELMQPKSAANAASASPELRSKVEIPYPPAAVTAHRQGSVILKVTVDATGAVTKMDVLDGDSLLAAQAVPAVRQWRYKPYQAAGHAVAMELLLTINFMLSPRS